MELINNLLDFIFTTNFYILVGKITTFVFLIGVLRGIHKQIYAKVYWYSYWTDKILLPYHWYKVMYVMNKSQVESFFKILSNESKLNPNLYTVRGWLIIRLRNIGYSDTEIENLSIEYRNNL